MLFASAAASGGGTASETWVTCSLRFPLNMEDSGKPCKSIASKRLTRLVPAGWTCNSRWPYATAGLCPLHPKRLKDLPLCDVPGWNLGDLGTIVQWFG